MKVLILGAGVIGVTSAFYLSQQGCSVTVLDRQPGPGLETSFANSGELTPGGATPWAAPGMFGQIARWLMNDRSPVAFKAAWDVSLPAWLLQFFENCNAESFRRNRAAMAALSRYSLLELRALREKTGIAYDQGLGGSLHIFRSQRELDQAAADIEDLRQLGLAVDVLSATECLTVEPGLRAAKVPVAGGIRFPDDETGDCHAFTAALAALAAASGTEFRFGAIVEKLVVEGGAVSGVIANGQFHRADAYVCSLGSFTPMLLRPLGLRLPISPVKGYSLSLNAVDPQGAPISTLMDSRYKVAITRLGNRIRIGGMAELAGFDLSTPERRRSDLMATYQDLFGEQDHSGGSALWCGLRPATPSGRPIIQQMGPKGLYVNGGHGTLGWTMACGSGRILADIVLGHSPALDLKEFAQS